MGWIIHLCRSCGSGATDFTTEARLQEFDKKGGTGGWEVGIAWKPLYVLVVNTGGSGQSFRRTNLKCNMEHCKDKLTTKFVMICGHLDQPVASFQ